MITLREAAKRLLQAIDAALPYAPHQSEFDVVADAADDLRAALNLDHELNTTKKPVGLEDKMSLREAAQQALEALDIGYDAAKAEADQYHAAMAGYRPERHAQIDTEVQQIAKAITALRAALAEPDSWQEEARRYAGNADYWRERLKAQQRGCQVCGIGANGETVGYVCTRGDCPTRVTCGVAP